MKKLPARRFHLVFSFIMGAMMVFLMSFVVTLVNIGWRADFLQSWANSDQTAEVDAGPVIYFLAPLARRIASRWAQVP